MFCNMLPISISYFALVLVDFVLFRTAVIILVILSNVSLLTLYFYCCVLFWHYYSIIHLDCANFVIGLRAVKFLHTNK
jgi:hypothetical protein